MPEIRAWLENLRYLEFAKRRKGDVVPCFFSVYFCTQQVT